MTAIVVKGKDGRTRVIISSMREEKGGAEVHELFFPVTLHGAIHSCTYGRTHTHISFFRKSPKAAQCVCMCQNNALLLPARGASFSSTE